MLSTDEAEKVDENIREVNQWWWLRAQKYDGALCVSDKGEIDYEKFFVVEEFSVRPALLLK